MYANSKYIGPLINSGFFWQNSSENGIESVFTLRGPELKLFLWMLFWLQWWSTKGYFCCNASEICNTYFITGKHWDYSSCIVWCGTPKSLDFLRHVMQENITVQLIVSSGFLESSENSFGGGLFFLFVWFGLGFFCFLFLVGFFS